jgi:hypothetical protein
VLTTSRCRAAPILGTFEREKICATITEGSVLTCDLDLVRNAARGMLVAALSCRDQ